MELLEVQVSILFPEPFASSGILDSHPSEVKHETPESLQGYIVGYDHTSVLHERGQLSSLRTGCCAHVQNPLAGFWTKNGDRQHGGQVLYVEMSSEVRETPADARSCLGQPSCQRNSLEFLKKEPLALEQFPLESKSMFQWVEAKCCQWAYVTKRTVESRFRAQKRLDQLPEGVRKSRYHEICRIRLEKSAFVLSLSVL